ncbi:hypothetical protein SeMB42_g01938 [Synchytrium endobioticum]|uniref:Uncharacterized protein n=1 Tax=Synchytrium endobioticum TaxID=286115 RepID=A0A507DD30_9FUNG|nr:hypothetical protein SeLEV6574_g01652 [Synchytrium endobioticum]TPX51331.1 hypothetical protein SeMB42_g01938 [Synchytrium endobioticum]
MSSRIGIPLGSCGLYCVVVASLPANVYLKETSPYMAFVGGYRLHLLWRCMQQLSLLVWFRSRYVIEELQENPSFTNEQVNGAVTKIADMAEYIRRAFEAYEGVAGGPDGQSHTSAMKKTFPCIVLTEALSVAVIRPMYLLLLEQIRADASCMPSFHTSYEEKCPGRSFGYGEKEYPSLDLITKEFMCL